MTTRLLPVLVAIGIGALSAIFGAETAASSMQLPTIYVEPMTGGPGDWFVFTGADFVPGTVITVAFIDPDGDLVRFKGDPVTADSTGAFRLPIMPALDLARVTEREVTVQIGRWFARFTLEDDTYYEQLFYVLPYG
jgi:hypothetical protein